MEDFLEVSKLIFSSKSSKMFRVYFKSLLYDILKKALTEKWEERQTLKELFYYCSKIMGADEWSFLVTPPNDRWFFYVWADYYDNINLVKLAEKIQNTPGNNVEEVMTKCKCGYMINVTASKKWANKSIPTKVWVGIRISHEKEIYGVLNLDYFENIRVTKKLITTGEIISEELSDFIAKFTKITEMIRTGEMDILTGLPNRLKLERDKEKLLKLKKKVLFIDLDDFKKINDQYGHEAGDETLKIIAQRLSRIVRKDRDYVYRYGGDEFLVFVPNESDAKVVADRIKKVLSSPVRLKDGTIVKVGVTIGIADMCESIDGSIKMADTEMYKRKRRKKG